MLKDQCEKKLKELCINFLQEDKELNDNETKEFAEEIIKESHGIALLYLYVGYSKGQPLPQECQHIANMSPFRIKREVDKYVNSVVSKLADKKMIKKLKFQLYIQTLKYLQNQPNKLYEVTASISTFAFLRYLQSSELTKLIEKLDIDKLLENEVEDDSASMGGEISSKDNR